jgi:hypothetical protein
LWMSCSALQILKEPLLTYHPFTLSENGKWAKTKVPDVQRRTAKKAHITQPQCQKWPNSLRMQLSFWGTRDIYSSLKNEYLLRMSLIKLQSACLSDKNILKYSAWNYGSNSWQK